jgi:hypothetical protein
VPVAQHSAQLAEQAALAIAEYFQGVRKPPKKSISLYRQLVKIADELWRQRW